MQSPTVSRPPNIATPGSDPQSTGSIARFTGSGRKRKTSLRGLESAAYFQAPSPRRQCTKLRQPSRPVDADLESMDGSMIVPSTARWTGRLMVPWTSLSSTRRSLSRLVLIRSVQINLEHFMQITLERVEKPKLRGPSMNKTGSDFGNGWSKRDIRDCWSTAKIWVSVVNFLRRFDFPFPNIYSTAT